jgi:hypothetical protein
MTSGDDAAPQQGLMLHGSKMKSAQAPGGRPKAPQRGVGHPAVG